MEQFFIAAALIAGAGGVAYVLQRRQPDAPTQPRTYRVPSQLDRGDFDRPDAPWLVAVFTSATCASCAGTWQKVQVLASDEVVVQEVEVSADRELHQRYRIDGVPLVVIADAGGVVRASFVGPATATDLWATVAELREPGSVPGGCDHGQTPQDPDGGGQPTPDQGRESA
ncbi:MAG: TlpA family protein disulfide reductase [Acidimicrobiales bacterium]